MISRHCSGWVGGSALILALGAGRTEGGSAVRFPNGKPQPSEPNPRDSAALTRVGWDRVDHGATFSPHYPPAPLQWVPAQSADTAVARLADWKLRRMDGATVTLADFRGRVVFLHLWATWCVVCRPELESIARLQRTLAVRAESADIVFLLVSPEDERIVARYMRRHPLSPSVYVEITAAPARFAIRTVPTTLILDRAGKIVARQDGRGAWDTAELASALVTVATNGVAAHNR